MYNLSVLIYLKNDNSRNSTTNTEPWWTKYLQSGWKVQSLAMSLFILTLPFATFSLKNFRNDLQNRFPHTTLSPLLEWLAFVIVRNIYVFNKKKLSLQFKMISESNSLASGPMDFGLLNTLLWIMSQINDQDIFDSARVKYQWSLNKMALFWFRL